MIREIAITADDIARYERDGAVLLKGVLDRDMLGMLEKGVEEIFRPDEQNDKAFGVDTVDGKTTVRDYALRQSHSLQALVKTGVVGKVASGLMQTPSARIVLDQVFHKASGPILPTPWHQDTPFLRVRGQDLIRLWIPCDFSPKELTVQVVRGSHRWNTVYSPGSIEPVMTAKGPLRGKSADEVGDSWLPPTPDVRRYRDSFDILRWDVEPGDVLAFQGNMLHGADGHPGQDTPRRAFAILLGGPELRYHRPDGKAFPSPGRMQGLIEKDDIPEGAPIGDYPVAFPPC